MVVLRRAFLSDLPLSPEGFFLSGLSSPSSSSSSGSSMISRVSWGYGREMGSGLRFDFEVGQREPPV